MKKTTYRDLIWAYSSQILNLGSGLILIPLAVAYLSTEELALWYIFLALGGVTQMLEFGFQPTIARLTSYAYSGATELLSEGVPKSNKENDIYIISDLMVSSRRIYQYIGVAACLLLGFLGTFYLTTITEYHQDVIYPWLIFVQATCVNFYYTYLNGILIGRGQQSSLYRVMAISKLSLLLIAAPLLWNGYGLFSMSIATLASVALNRVLVFKIYNADHYIRKIQSESIVGRPITNIIWKAAWKLGLNNIGVFLSQRVSVLLVGSFLSLTVTASYGLTMQVLTVIFNISMVLFNINLPRLNSLQLNNKSKDIKMLFKNVYAKCLTFYIVNSFIIYFYGQDILNIFGFDTSLVDESVLLAIISIQVLELSHTICMGYLTSYNRVPFYRINITTGLLIVITSYLLLNSTELGLIGVVLTYGFFQIVINNWYWPMIVYKDLSND